MKKIWLLGGFGNVLFQILAFNIISKTNNNVFFVKKLTENNIITKLLGLAVFQDIWNDLIDEKKYFHMSTFTSSIIIFTGFLSKKFNLKIKLATYHSSTLNFDKNISNNNFGYYQDKIFLKEYQKDLFDLGRLLNIKYGVYEKNPIVVHYRKGDSIWADKFSNYYEEIKNMLKNEISPIIIVTDSEKDAISFFSSVDNTRIMSSNNDLDDFKYLLSAKKLYCAPSTFSWWAAHSLDDNSEVIMPSFLNEELGIYVKNKNIVIL